MDDWRAKKPTPKQVDWLRAHGLSVPKTRGDANHKIYKAFNKMKRLREEQDRKELEDASDDAECSEATREGGRELREGR